MTRQRRRGRPVTFYPQKLVTDNRGNPKYLVDHDSPIEVRCWIYPQRSSKAEVPGQVGIDVIRVGFNTRHPDGTPIEGVSLWSMARYNGRDWDLVSPPELHWGTRHTHHYSVDMRARPGDPGTGITGG